MKVWLTSFGCLFAFVEFYRWLENFTIPMPVCIVGGVCLAIASNSEFLSKIVALKPLEVKDVRVEPIPLQASVQPQLEEQQPSTGATHTVSFKIDKPDWSKTAN